MELNTPFNILKLLKKKNNGKMGNIIIPIFLFLLFSCHTNCVYLLVVGFIGFYDAVCRVCPYHEFV